MDEIMRIFNTNVFATVRTAKAVIPHMASRKRGTVVNVGSIAGIMYACPVPSESHITLLLTTTRNFPQTHPMGRGLQRDESSATLADRHALHGV